MPTAGELAQQLVAAWEALPKLYPPASWRPPPPDSQTKTSESRPSPTSRLQLFIGGEFVDAASGKTFPVLDPRTGEEVFRVAEADKADVEK